MKLLNKYLRRILFGILALGLLGLAGIGALFAILIPQLPSVEVLRDVQFQVPLQVFTEDRQLVAEYGTKKRIPLSYDQIPEPMIKAVLAAEDDRFFHHPGVDYQGLVRAAVVLATTGEKAQGGSTITMQVARNFFLSSEKTYLRKLNEILLSFKIEQELTKEQILELYLNKIYLGNRAYGVGAAAQIYYGKPLSELTVDQFAMIAGLPKAPSRYNPIADPERALLRRNYVLKRMRQLHFITDKEYETAVAQPSNALLHATAVAVDAPYVGEMVRADLYAQYGEDAYTKGLKAYVTLNPAIQKTADIALRKGLLDYERRHGYRGAVRKVKIDSGLKPEEQLDLLASDSDIGGLKPALIYAAQLNSAAAILADGSKITIDESGLSWARRPGKTGNPVAAGDIVYVENIAPGQWSLAQVPEVAGAIVSVNPYNGAVLALSGGFDFYQSKFNRVIQAQRQPGSSFKPFVYSAALEQGFTAASIINDAPVVFDDPSLESAWRPENFSGKFYGPTRLREALTHSRNLVSIRLLQSIGIDYALDYVTRFGFDRSRQPRDLSLSLGSGVVTPLELARGYSVFANGGFLVQPYYLARVEDNEGKVLFQAKPVIACRECEPAVIPAADGTEQPEVKPVTTTSTGLPLAKRVISPQNVYIMTSMMRDVIRAGTATRAMQLGRSDLAGKTGTTNDQRDAWFAGFNSDLVTISWVGFDDSHPLGNDETGGRSALPVWMDVMRVALDGKPQLDPPQPPGLISVRIDPETGMLARANQANAIFEIFKIEDAPQRHSDEVDDSVSSPGRARDGSTGSSTTPLF